MKKTLIISALALTAVAAFAQDKTAAKPAATPAKPAATAAPQGDPVVISANGVSITKSEFEEAIKTLPPQYQAYAMGPQKKQFAEDYLRMRLLANEGMAAGLDKSPAIQKQLDLMRQNLVASEQAKTIEKSINVTDADAKAYYDQHKSEYEQVKARHILVAFAGGPAAPKGEGKKALTDEEAKKKAEDTRAKLAAGAAFAEHAKKESDDTGSGQNGGDLGAFSRGQMVPEFEKAAFEAKVNEITPVVKTQFGYHIIQVTAHEFTPFDQVKPSIEKELKQKKMQEALDSIKDKANPKSDEAYFNPPPAAMPNPAPAPAPAKKQ